MVLFEIIKQSLSKIDCLLIVAALFIFSTLDYSNLSLDDKIYLGVFGIWMVMLAVRIFITYKNGGNHE